MLVLSRKVGERIVIGDNITLVVNRIEGHRVSLGIEAPSRIRIVRGELAPFDVNGDAQEYEQENVRYGAQAGAQVGAQMPASFAPITFHADPTSYAPRIAR